MRQFKRTWIGVMLGTLIALGGTVATSAKRLEPAPVVMAVDALGKEIGQVLKMDFSLQTMQVAIEIEGELIPVLVRKDSFSHGAQPIVYFESPDCTGLPHLGTSPTEASIGPVVAIAGPRGTVYRGDPDRRQERAIASAMWGSDCTPFGGTIAVIDAEPILDLADHFIPPFGIASGADDAKDGSSRGQGRPQGRD